MHLTLTRYAKVTGVKPKLIKAFDYYNPERMSVRQYRLKNTAGVCGICGVECVGCPAPPRRTEDGTKLINFYCEEADFPCPDFSDGLYYDPSSQVAELMEIQHPDITRKCSVSGIVESSQKFPGPPGTYINGTIQSIECGGTNDFKDALNSRKGFTLSLMFHLTEKMSHSDHTFLSIGERGSQPLMELQRRSGGYRVRVRLHGYEFTTTFSEWYMRNGLAVGEWARLVLVFRDGPFPELYINNRKVNPKNEAKWAVTPKVKGDVILTIGKTNEDDKHGIVGLVSNLDFWKRPLSNSEIGSHFQYHLDMMLEKDPLFTEGQAQHAIPEALWPCLEDSYVRASVLKVGIGEEPALCEGQGYH